MTRTASSVAGTRSQYAAAVVENGSTLSSSGQGIGPLAPWEPGPGWHRARLEAFVVFRDMPERSYPKVARALAKSTTPVKR